MAWQTPKTNWTKEDVAGVADLNRIEGNIAELKKAATIEVADVAGNFTSIPKTLENVLNELAGDVKNGKAAIASAIVQRNGSANATDTFTALANSILAIPVVKSVQQGYVFTSKPPANTTVNIQQTVTINAVDTSKSIILITPLGNPRVAKITFENAYFNNSTSFTIKATIKIYESFDTEEGLGFGWTVIEFQPSVIKSLQQGSGSASTVTLDIPINPVNPIKSIVIVQGWVVQGDYSAYGYAAYFMGIGGILTSNTNLRLIASDGPSTYQKPYFWQVVEFAV